MRALIIGGTGFVGEYVSRVLAQAGLSVLAVHGSLLEEEPIAGVEYRQIDLDEDLLKFKATASECDTIIFSIQPDVFRMKKIISVLSSNDFINKIVYLSTLLVYPDSAIKSGEDQATDPLTEYERNKGQEENLLAQFTKNNGCRFVVARLGNVYGDRKNRGVVNYLMRAVTSGNTFVINGNGQQIRDYIFVEDVARLLKFIILLEQKDQKEIFNVCSGRGSSILNLIKLVEAIAGKKIKVKFGNPVKEKASIIGDNTKLLKLSGLQSQYDLPGGVKKAYENYLKCD